MRSVLYVLALAAALVLCGMAMFGCAQPSPKAQQQVQSTIDQGAEDAAAVDAQAKVDAEKAKAAEAAADADPVKHPIQAAGNATKKAQKPLGFIATIAAVACAVGIGLYFTKLSWLSTILVPVGGAVAAFCYIGVIALPFFPLAALGLAVLFFVLAIYELIRNKGSVPKTVQAVETDLGVKTPPAPAPSSTVQVQLVHT